MPLPPEEAEDGESAATEEPKLQFSYVECLLFSFHQLGKKLPDFLLEKVDAERLKDFKTRWGSCTLSVENELARRACFWAVELTAVVTSLCVSTGYSILPEACRFTSDSCEWHCKGSREMLWRRTRYPTSSRATHWWTQFCCEPSQTNSSSLRHQNKIKVVALKITNNINVLIKVERSEDVQD